MPDFLLGLFGLLTVALGSIPALALNNFTFTAPTQCDNLNISWSGGSGPFSLLITPLLNVPFNISLPDSSFDNDTKTGFYSLQLPLPAKRQFLLSLSDSTGFASSTISNVLTVGSSISGANCNTTGVTPPYTFQLNTALKQCEEFTFSGFNGSVPPVSIFGLIPLGQPFELKTSSAPRTDEFNWTADVLADTSIVFLMFDSKGRSGGSSGIEIVNQTSDSSCLNASSPSSTTSAFSIATSTSAAIPAQTTVVKSGSNTGTIVGAVLGGLALLGTIALSILLCLRRRQRKNSVFDEKLQAYPAVIGNRGTSCVSRAFRPWGGRAPASFDLLHSSLRSLPRVSPQPNASFSSVSAPFDDNAMPNPYILPSTKEASIRHSTQDPQVASGYVAESPHSSSFGPSMHPSLYDVQSQRSNPLSPLPAPTEIGSPRSPTSIYSNLYSMYSNHGHAHRTSMPYSVATARSGKTSGGGTDHSVPRLILHTDAEDPNPESDEEVVELPPQYNGRRRGAPDVPNEKGRPPTPPPHV